VLGVRDLSPGAYERVGGSTVVDGVHQWWYFSDSYLNKIVVTDCIGKDVPSSPACPRSRTSN
jgi:hypothetical protein